MSGLEILLTFVQDNGVFCLLGQSYARNGEFGIFDPLHLDLVHIFLPFLNLEVLGYHHEQNCVLCHPLRNTHRFLKTPQLSIHRPAGRCPSHQCEYLLRCHNHERYFPFRFSFPIHWEEKALHPTQGD
ncbi:MAG: hypothetical protein DWQ01_11010 [Planctomycetota bacterium]|nr:MAG: hypothetical protein DWQ01_11010 [Planctomycetota bacterium]